MRKKVVLNIYDFFNPSMPQIKAEEMLADLIDRLNLLVEMRIHKSFFKDGDKLLKLVKVDQLDARAEFKFIEHAINVCINKFLDNIIAELDLYEELGDLASDNFKSNGKANE